MSVSMHKINILKSDKYEMFITIFLEPWKKDLFTLCFNAF